MREFSPGFRMAKSDIVFLLISTVAAIVAWPWGWYLGLSVIWAVGHFFLFCNVFRINRTSELLWASAFCAMGFGSLMHEIPSWMATFVLSLILGLLFCFFETRRSSYHGVFWRKFNPRLPEWWADRVAKGD
jgi:O-antigen/teichoic acid export membrane protein